MKSFKISLAIVWAAFTINSNGQGIQSGLRLIELEKYSQAKNFFKNLCQKEPTNPEGYYYLGEVYSENDQPDSAKAMYIKASTLNPQHPITYIAAGKLGLENDNSQEYQKNFDKAISIVGPKDIKTMILIAEAYIKASNKKITQAIIVLNKALEANNKNAETYITLGTAYLEQGDGGKAITNYEKALQFDKSSAKAYTKIGELYTRARNYAEALAGFQNAIKADSLYSPAYKGLSELYYQGKKVELALSTYKNYMRLSDPNSLQGRSRYASFLYLNKEYSKAKEIINEVIKQDSSNIIMKRLLGYSLYEEKEYEKGLKYLESFFAKIDKKKIIASDYEYMGKLLAKNGKDSLAIDNFKKTLEKDAGKTDVYHEMAMSYNKLKKFDEAAKLYEKKMNETKPNATDYVYMGRALYNAGNYLKSDSIFTKVIELQPNYAEAYLYKGRSNSALDNVREDKAKTYSAKPFYEKFIELASADPVKNKKTLVEAYEYLFFYYIQKEDNANSKEMNKKILEVDPENKKAKENQKQLK